MSGQPTSDRNSGFGCNVEQCRSFILFSLFQEEPVATGLVESPAHGQTFSASSDTQRIAGRLIEIPTLVDQSDICCSEKASRNRVEHESGTWTYMFCQH